MWRRKPLYTITLILLIPGVVGAASVVYGLASGRRPVRVSVPSDRSASFRNLDSSQIQTLRSIQTESHQKVTALLQEHGSSMSPVEHERIQAQIVRIKSEGELQFLKANLHMAEDRGKSAEIRIAEQALHSFERSRQFSSSPQAVEPQIKKEPPGGRP